MKIVAFIIFLAATQISGCATSPTSKDWERAADHLAATNEKIAKVSEACASAVPNQGVSCLIKCQHLYYQCLKLAGDNGLLKYICYQRFEECTLPCDPI